MAICFSNQNGKSKISDLEIKLLERTLELVRWFWVLTVFHYLWGKLFHQLCFTVHPCEIGIVTPHRVLLYKINGAWQVIPFSTFSCFFLYLFLFHVHYCEDIRSSGAGLTDHCELLYGCSGLNLGLLGEQLTFLTAKPSLQIPPFKYILI